MIDTRRETAAIEDLLGEQAYKMRKKNLHSVQVEVTSYSEPARRAAAAEYRRLGYNVKRTTDGDAKFIRLSRRGD